MSMIRPPKYKSYLSLSQFESATEEIGHVVTQAFN